MSIRHQWVALFLFHLIVTPLVSTPASADKNVLRKALREARRSLSPAQQQRAGEDLLSQLLTLDLLRESKCIALYLPNDGEIDPSGLIRWCGKHDRSAFLPVVRQQDGVNSLLFAPVDLLTTFKDNQFGIPEPVVEAGSLVTASDLDLVLLPLVGFDGRGNRVGMGGGFYDRTFSFLHSDQAGRTRSKPTLVGIAHALQEVDRIDAESWDVPLSVVVTDKGVITLGRER